MVAACGNGKARPAKRGDIDVTENIVASVIIAACRIAAARGYRVDEAVTAKLERAATARKNAFNN